MLRNIQLVFKYVVLWFTIFLMELNINWYSEDTVDIKLG